MKLLDVQELDNRIDHLRHQLDTLPQTRELATLTATRAQLAGRERDLLIDVNDLTREQRKADADVEQVKSRRTRDRDRMDRGLVTNPKDLARMQQELVSLDRRVAELEDTELEVMEQLEEAQTALSEVQHQLGELDEKMAAVSSDRDETAGGLREQLSEVTAEREATAKDLPDDLLGVYARLRAQKGGVGVGALRARRCSGCGLDINAADLAVIAKAPVDDVLRCEECDRILVRTAESGL